MDVSLADLFLAYRQAKNALPHEQHGLGGVRLARAENRLDQLLERVRLHLARTPSWFGGLSVGRVWLVPKRTRPNPNEQINHVGRPPGAAIERIDTRLHLTPSLPFAITEVLWLWTFGPALETILTPNVRANRLRTGRAIGVDKHSRWLFHYWEPAYKAFRDDGFAQAERLLTEGSRRCLLTTLDLASYYDELDPSFLVSDDFIHSVSESAASAGVAFEQHEYRRSASGLIRSFEQYRRRAALLTGRLSSRGIPIGCLTVKLIANLALSTLDSFISSRRGVRYYARYVDDILIVADSADAPASSRAVAERFLPLGKDRRPSDNITLDHAYLRRPGSRLTLQTNKLRAHYLYGRGGRDFLKTIKRDLRLIVSERRAFLPPDGLGSRSPLTPLFVGSDHQAPIHVLRNADRLKISRYAAGTLLSRVAVGVRLLRPPESSQWCGSQLRSLVSAIVDSNHWVDFLELGFGAFGTSVRALNRDIPRHIVDAYQAAVSHRRAGRSMSTLFWNGFKLPKRAWQHLQAWEESRLREEVCRSLPLELLQERAILHRFLRGIGLRSQPRLRRAFASSQLVRDVTLLVQADLRAEDRETDLANVADVASMTLGWEALKKSLSHDTALADRIVKVDGFIHVAREAFDAIYSNATAVGILLMTRPPTMFDVAYRYAKLGRDPAKVTDIINAIRGTRYPTSTFRTPDPHVMDTSRRAGPKRSPILVLANLPLPEAWFTAAANGGTVLNAARAADLNRVVNVATSKRDRTGRNVVLVLPELSVPRVWLRHLAERLISEEVDFVAGLEYSKSGDVVVNEAIGVFTTGYETAAICIWPKTHAARHEHQELKALGRTLQEYKGPRWLVNTDYGALTTLICSELLDVEQRAPFRGRIDFLLVPSWNPDTATFDHTAQTTANDLHCYAAIANNARFSDCRIQVPAGKRWERDVCRLICRDEAETIACEIDVEKLRHFQRESIANPAKDLKDFKPIPPGFRYRRP